MTEDRSLDNFQRDETEIVENQDYIIDVVIVEDLPDGEKKVA